MNATQKCGYIGIIGRTNVGKSTLLNTLVGAKASITSDKPQTTRVQIQGIRTDGNNQLVFIDTPGRFRKGTSRLDKMMLQDAINIIPSCDVVVWMVRPRWHREDDLVLKSLLETIESQPLIVVINACERLKPKTAVLHVLDEYRQRLAALTVAQWLPISALHGHNCDALLQTIDQYLPENTHVFAKNHQSQHPTEFASELIREKIYRYTGDEIPYQVFVDIENDEIKNTIHHIDATINVGHINHKGIVIGTGGERLRKIASLARIDIEKNRNAKVMLRLWVKVNSNWWNDPRVLRPGKP